MISLTDQCLNTVIMGKRNSKCHITEVPGTVMNEFSNWTETNKGPQQVTESKQSQSPEAGPGKHAQSNNHSCQQD